MTPSSLEDLSERHKMPQLQLRKDRVTERRVQWVEVISQPGVSKLAKSTGYLEMILQVHAEAEKLDVVGPEPARYRFTIGPGFP